MEYEQSGTFHLVYEMVRDPHDYDARIILLDNYSFGCRKMLS